MDPYGTPQSSGDTEPTCYAAAYTNYKHITNAYSYLINT